MDTKIQQETIFSNLGKDILIYIPSFFIQNLFLFFGLLLYSRFFKVEEFGKYNLILSTINFLSIFSYFWINQAILRFYSRYKEEFELQELFSTFFIIFFINLAFISLFFYSFGNIVNKDILNFSQKEFFLIIIVTVSNAFYDTLITILRAGKRPKDILIYKTLNSIVFFSVIVLSIYFGKFNIELLLEGMVSINVVICIIIFYKINLINYLSIGFFRGRSLIEFSSYGLPMIPYQLCIWLLSLSDRYFLQYYRGYSEVGIYSATYQLAWFPITSISSIALLAAYPVVFETWEKYGEVHTKSLMTTIIRYYIILTIPILFGFTLLSNNILILLGKNYSGGVSLIPWLVLGSFALGLNYYTSIGIDIGKKTYYFPFTLGVSAILSVALNLILIPRYGMYGASISCASSNLINLLLNERISQRFLNLRYPFNTIIKSLVASIAMSIVLFCIKLVIKDINILDTFALFLIGSIVYLSAIYKSGEINNEFLIAREFIMRISKYNYRIRKPN